MGYSLSWLAVKDVGLDRILECLQMERTNDVGEFHRRWEICHLDMNNGWQLVSFGGQDILTEQAPLLERLSFLGTVVAVFVHEGAMMCAAEGWEKGARKWLVSHELDRGQTHLHTEGQLPDCFESVFAQVKEEAEANEFDCDYYFDIPVQIGFQIVGFIHDRTVFLASEI
jgi:hypothetical protein